MLTANAQAWFEAGKLEPFGRQRLFVHEQPGQGPPLLLLHGYPSSSFDWRLVCDRLRSRWVTAFDFLGFGLSDKPRDHRYSLMTAADHTEAVAARFEGAPVVLVAHDMGTSVATELLARDLAGELSFRLGSVVLSNGSMVIERATLTVSQRLLQSRFGSVAARLSNESAFRAQMSRIFSAEHPLTAQEAADQWSLVAHNNGHRLLDKLMIYLRERMQFADRWHGALRDWPGHLEFLWAMRDPVCTKAVLDAVIDLRPDTVTTLLPDLGHYPQLEDPDAVTGTIKRVIDETAAAAGS